MTAPVVVIDAGNHSCKVAVAYAGRLASSVEHATVSELPARVDYLLRWQGARACLVCSVVDGLEPLATLLADRHVPLATISCHSHLPFRIAYDTPETLGADRIAAMAGLVARRGLCDALVIDAGTAITYDFLSAQGLLLGGAITPGLDMRYQALHEHTAHLPLCHAGEATQTMPTSTRQAIASGVLQGARAEARHFAALALHKNPHSVVALTGGDCNLFEMSAEIDNFAAPNLVLEGLAHLALHNC